MPKAQVGFAAPLGTPPFPLASPQAGGPYVNAGAPTAGTNAVQSIVFGGTPTGGTFILSFNGVQTGNIAWSATDATLSSNIAAALNALPNIGPNGVAVSTGTSSGIGTDTITFQNQNAALPVPTILVYASHLTGTSPTVAVNNTTTGVAETVRGAYPGTVVYDYVGYKGWELVGPFGAQVFVRNGKRMAVVPLTGVSSTSGGGIATWQPAEGVGVIITRCLVNITTKSTGSANLTVGEGSSATTSYTNLVTATAVGSAAVLIDSIQNQTANSNAATSLVMAAGNYVTFTGSASTAGMVGTAYIEYFVP